MMHRLVGADHFTDALFLFLGHLRGCLLRVAPVVENANLVNALEGARRRAPFLGFVLAIEIFHRVLLEWDSRITALLRAPVDQTFFANVQIARAGTTAPVIRFAFRDAVLKPIESRVILVSEFLYFLEDLFLFRRERFQSAVAVVNDADSGRETKLDGTASDS